MDFCFSFSELSTLYVKEFLKRMKSKLLRYILKKNEIVIFRRKVMNREFFFFFFFFAGNEMADGNLKCNKRKSAKGFLCINRKNM